MFVSGEKLFLGAALKTKAERSRILGGICSATSVLSHSCCLLSYHASVIRRYFYCDTEGIKHQKDFAHEVNAWGVMYPITLNVLLLRRMILFSQRLSQYPFFKRFILGKLGFIYIYLIFLNKGDKT